MSQAPVPAIAAPRVRPDAERLALAPAAPAPAGAGQPTGRATEPAPSSAPPSPTAVLQLSRETGPTEVYARYTVDSETNIVSISIVDAATKEVIHEVPPEAVIKLAKLLQQQAIRRGQPAGASPARDGGQVINHTV